MLQLGAMADVPQFQLFLAMMLGLAAIIAFILLIDMREIIRPVSLVGRIGEQGIEVIKSVYPDPVHNVAAPVRPPEAWLARSHYTLSRKIRNSSGHKPARADVRGTASRHYY